MHKSCSFAENEGKLCLFIPAFFNASKVLHWKNQPDPPLKQNLFSSQPI